MCSRKWAAPPRPGRKSAVVTPGAWCFPSTQTVKPLPSRANCRRPGRQDPPGNAAAAADAALEAAPEAAKLRSLKLWGSRRGRQRDVDSLACLLRSWRDLNRQIAASVTGRDQRQAMGPRRQAEPLVSVAEAAREFLHCARGDGVHEHHRIDVGLDTQGDRLAHPDGLQVRGLDL